MATAKLTHRAIDRVQDAVAYPGDSQVLGRKLVLPFGNFAATDPFIMLSEDWFTSEGGFEYHPHRGMETVTIVLEGSIEHRDNHGNAGILRKNDAQWMTAGRGIIHSEQAHGAEVVHSLQLWLNLPARDKLTEPGYQDIKREQMPVRRGEGYEAYVISGMSGDVRGAAKNHWPVTIIDLEAQSGSRFEQELDPSEGGFIYVLEGSATIGDKLVTAGQTALFAPITDDDASDVTVLSIQAHSTLRALLFAGAPIGERIVQRGPFVMNTERELYQAFVDYGDGKFGPIPGE